MKITEDILKEVYPPREKTAKKYDHGSVLLISGSQIYTGSPGISAMAALRAGADVTKVAAPERAADVVAALGPDMITQPLRGEALSSDHLSKLLEITKGMESVSSKISVVIGPGVGRREETKKLIRDYVKNTDVPLVIDADGIYAFEEKGKEFLTDKCLLTPHLYEFSILTGEDISNLSTDQRAQKVKSFAAEMGVTLALKGATDIVSDGSDIALNEMSVPELTAGGCGDSLAGIAGAALSRTGNPFKAAMAATYLNTKAGSLAAEEKGDSLISKDLIDKLPEAINY